MEDACIYKKIIALIKEFFFFFYIPWKLQCKIKECRVQAKQQASLLHYLCNYKLQKLQTKKDTERGRDYSQKKLKNEKKMKKSLFTFWITCFTFYSQFYVSRQLELDFFLSDVRHHLIVSTKVKGQQQSSCWKFCKKIINIQLVVRERWRK